MGHGFNKEVHRFLQIFTPSIGHGKGFASEVESRLNAALRCCEGQSGNPVLCIAWSQQFHFDTRGVKKKQFPAHFELRTGSPTFGSITISHHKLIVRLLSVDCSALSNTEVAIFELYEARNTLGQKLWEL